MRSRYESAKEQLAKGERMFQNVLKPLAHVPESWNYIGLIAFPEIPNREMLAECISLTTKETEVKF